MGDSTQAFNWQAMAAQAGADAANGILGIVSANFNDKRQLRQQQKLQDLQIKGNKQMMDYQQQLALQMWKDTSYSAQKEQMKKAGINPALMYGMGGGGGQTIGNASAGVSGAQAPGGGGELQGLLGLQRNMIAAQIENIKADTNLKNTDATKTAGVDTTLAKQTIENMAQELDNKRWEWELLRINKAMKEMEKYAAEKTLDQHIEGIIATYKTQVATMREKMVDANVAESTQNEKIQQVQANLVGTYLENQLKQAGIYNTQWDTFKIANDIAQGWQKLRIEEQEMYVKQYMAKIGASAIPAYMMTDIVKTLGGIFAAGKLFSPTEVGRTVVQGFGRGN